MDYSKLIILKDLLGNKFFGSNFDLSYIIETKDWSISWDGRQITRALNRQNLLKARTATCIWGLKKQIVHYGSVNLLLAFGLGNQSNKYILTWFHFVPEQRNDYIRQIQPRLSFVHTSCEQTQNALIDFGIDPAKIKVIPLGVDLDIFTPLSEQTKKELRTKLGLPPDRFIIGSFQKDGVGWGRGLEPKLIKGPDVLVEVLKILSGNYPIFVLLAGPARGYVKKALEQFSIPFLDLGNLPLTQMNWAYSVLDLYLITSRVEGGPKAILEAMACGVPLVTTKVGMAPDIQKQWLPELLMADIDNAAALADLCARVFNNKAFALQIIQKQQQTVQHFSWEEIAKAYFEQMYSKLLY